MTTDPSLDLAEPPIAVIGDPDIDHLLGHTRKPAADEDCGDELATVH